MSAGPMACHWCHGTRVIVDGGSTFPCHVCKPPPAVLSQVEAVIYGTTYALVLDRGLHEVWRSGASTDGKEMELAERRAIQHAISAASGAVLCFRGGASEANAVWDGTETGRLYTAALTQKR